MCARRPKNRWRAWLAKFIAVEDEEFKQAETSAGYAKEMSDEYKKKQAELVAKHMSRQDMVITTALIPGRPAPRLITKEMVESMPAGAVIVDLAAERGGNCELTQPGKIIEHKGVSIMGKLNLAGESVGQFFLALCAQSAGFPVALYGRREKRSWPSTGKMNW